VIDYVQIYLFWLVLSIKERIHGPESGLRRTKKEPMSSENDIRSYSALLNQPSEKDEGCAAIQR
jgi:hypothetical protein